MCGIYGEVCVTTDPEARRRFAAAADANLARRGPDGSGNWQSPHVLLGHRRLAIIDLTDRASQPMVSASGASVLVFNGEIYNYRELRAQLTPPAGGWRSSSDTEVLLELLEQRGLPGLQAVVGMFALALWSPRMRCLWLVRDRLGKKPLYYHLSPERIRFASEAQALLADGSVPVTTTPDRLAEFLQHGYVAAPRSAFAQLNVLPPAHWLEVRVGEGALAPRIMRYWSLPTEPTQADYAGWREELAATIEDATRIRLRSDVPVGAFLSGGVDSSVVCEVASRRLTGALRTFTVDFDEQAFSEGQYAAEVAQHIGSDHTSITLPPPALGEVEALVDTYGDLHGDVSAVPTMALCRRMREHVKVAIAGDGGDELLGGYARYVLSLKRTRRAGVIPERAQRALRLVGSRCLPPWVRGASFLGRVTSDLDAYYAREVRMYPAQAWPAILRPTTRPPPPDPVECALARHSDRAPLLRMMAADTETYLPEDNLVKVDRASMAVGLEVRAPLLDHRLFELVYRASPDWIFRDGRGKQPLRDIFAPRLPPAVFARRKMGFSVPLNRWMNGAATATLAYRLLRSRGGIGDVIDRQAVAAMLGAYRLRVHASAGRLWHLFVLERWFNRWKPTVLEG